MFTIKARRLSIEAYTYLGRARELKRRLQNGWFRPGHDHTIQDTISHLVKLARFTHRTALLYRAIK